VVVVAVNAEAVERVVGVIELDEHGFLVANHPRVVTWLDEHGLRRNEVEPAAIGILASEAALSDESNMNVLALIGVEERFDVLGPSTGHAVHKPLDMRLAGGHHVNFHRTERLVMRTFDRLQNRHVTH
jgi:hypothetical protein